jgi:hypothetical protein
MNASSITIDLGIASLSSSSWRSRSASSEPSAKYGSSRSESDQSTTPSIAFA